MKNHFLIFLPKKDRTATIIFFCNRCFLFFSCVPELFNIPHCNCYLYLYSIPIISYFAFAKELYGSCSHLLLPIIFSIAARFSSPSVIPGIKGVRIRYGFLQLFRYLKFSRIFSFPTPVYFLCISAVGKFYVHYDHIHVSDNRFENFRLRITACFNT